MCQLRTCLWTVLAAILAAQLANAADHGPVFGLAKLASTLQHATRNSQRRAELIFRSLRPSGHCSAVPCLHCLFCLA